MKKLNDGYIYLSHEDIYDYIKNRPPMLMIEDIYVKPGEMAYSERVLQEDEWYFACHFPGNPMMPGVLQLESMFNSAALSIKVIDGNKDKTTNISKISSVQYKRHIRPGDKMKVIVKVNKFRRGVGFMHGEILVDGSLCCESDFVLVLLDDLVEIGGK